MTSKYSYDYEYQIVSHNNILDVYIIIKYFRINVKHHHINK